MVDLVVVNGLLRRSLLRTAPRSAGKLKLVAAGGVFEDRPLPEEFSALRVLDVIAWREGKDKGL